MYVLCAVENIKLLETRFDFIQITNPLRKIETTSALSNNKIFTNEFAIC